MQNQGKQENNSCGDMPDPVTFKNPLFGGVTESHETVTRYRLIEKLKEDKRLRAAKYSVEISGLVGDLAGIRTNQREKQAQIEICSEYVSGLNPADNDYEQANIRLSLMETEMEDLDKQVEIVETVIKKLEEKREKQFKISAKELQEIVAMSSMATPSPPTLSPEADHRWPTSSPSSPLSKANTVSDRLCAEMLERVESIEQVNSVPLSLQDRKRLFGFFQELLNLKKTHDERFPDNKFRSQILNVRALDHMTRLNRAEAASRACPDPWYQEDSPPPGNALEGMAAEPDDGTELVAITPSVLPQSIPSDYQFKVVNLHRKYPDF